MRQARHNLSSPALPRIPALAEPRKRLLKSLQKQLGALDQMILKDSVLRDSRFKTPNDIELLFWPDQTQLELFSETVRLLARSLRRRPLGWYGAFQVVDKKWPHLKLMGRLNRLVERFVAEMSRQRKSLKSPTKLAKELLRIFATAKADHPHAELAKEFLAWHEDLGGGNTTLDKVPWERFEPLLKGDKSFMLLESKLPAPTVTARCCVRYLELVRAGNILASAHECAPVMAFVRWIEAMDLEDSAIRDQTRAIKREKDALRQRAHRLRQKRRAFSV